MGLADGQHAAVVTCTKDGRPKPTPIWPVAAGDGKVGFVTEAGSWKVRRLRNDDRVQVQPSDGRGRVKEGTRPVSGTAVVVEGAELDAIQAAVKSKYGWQWHAIRGVERARELVTRRTPSERCAVVITGSDDPASEDTASEDPASEA